MTIAQAALIAIAIAAVWIGRSVSRIGGNLVSTLGALSEELKSLRKSLVFAWDPSDQPESDFTPALNQLNNTLRRIAEFTQGARNHLSTKKRRIDGIVQEYAQYLHETEGLTQEQALLKARYIAQEFEGWLVERSEFRFGFGPPRLRPYSKAFENSEVFANDIKKAEARLVPFDLFSALWIVLRKEEYKPGTLLSMAHYNSLVSDKFEDYSSLLKRKAIIARLLATGLLTEEPPGRNGLTRYKLVQEDLEALGALIYSGARHGDNYLEESWEEERLLKVLEKAVEQP